MHAYLGPRLSAMMFLQFFIWGSWYVTAPLYLGKIGFQPADFAWTYAVGPIAGIISPFFLGMVADRFFSTERVLAVMHLLGAGAMYAAVTMMAQPDPSPNAINGLFFVHMLCFFPTLSLTNTLALHNMTDAERQFPLIRVFGTIGWIVAGLALDRLGWTTDRSMFWLTIGSGVLLGVYSLTLPHTPPPMKGQPASARELLGMDAFVLLKRRSFLVFIVSSFLICIPLAFYYQLAAKSVQQTGVTDVGTTMAYGQMSEIVFMLLMPLFFKRLGVKWMLLVGMGAWVLRYGLFAYGAQVPNPVIWMMIVGVLLHGICYDFFFVTGQIYTDKVAPSNIRGQAQGMLVLFTLGIGMLIGAQIAGAVEAEFQPVEAKQLNAEAKQHGDTIKVAQEKQDKILADFSKEQLTTFTNWRQATTALSDVHAAFQPDVPSTDRIIPGIPTRISAVREITGNEPPTYIQEPLELQETIDTASALRDAKSLKALQLLDWAMIWGIPCAAAFVVMVVFAVLFRDDSDEAATADNEDIRAPEPPGPGDVRVPK